MNTNPSLKTDSLKVDLAESRPTGFPKLRISEKRSLKIDLAENN
jgi:hypothetical protein